MSEWQPIESAPKGEAVWVAFDQGYKSKVLATTCACWFDFGELENNGGGDEDYLPAGWYEYPALAEECMALPNEPTHWMPLPTAPSAQEGKP